MKNKVAIGVSILNEENNIPSLIRAILNQNEDGFSISEILLLSDGSVDKTNNIITEFAKKDKRIKALIFTDRQGKPKRVNQLFALSSADVLVILDGDIRINSSQVIAKVVQPILDKNAALTSGVGKYRPGSSYFERIIQTGIDMWSDIKTAATDAEMYTCEGKIRAFSRELYKQMLFPSLSAEDVYPYLYCQEHGLAYRYVPEAVVYYRLPTTIKDYIKQHTRFLHSETIQSQNFSEQLVRKHYTISWREKLPVVLRYFLKRPIQVVSYLFLLIAPKLMVYLESDSQKGDWSIIQSTKV